MDVEGDDEDEDEDEDEDDRMDDDVDDIDDASGVHDAAAASSIARRAESAKAAAVNAAANARARRTKGSEDGGGGRNAVVLGTAAKVGETFFARLIAVLASLVRLRGLARAAADASGAWAPRGSRPTARRWCDVVEPLVDLYAEARHPKKAKAPSEAAASEDAGAALSVLARWTRRGARAIAMAARGGERVVEELLAREGESPGQSPKGGEGGAAERGTRGFDRELADRAEKRRLSVEGTSPNIRRTRQQRPRLRRVGERRPEMTRPRERVERGRARERPFESRLQKKTPFGLTDGPFSRVASRDVRGRTHVIYHII